jgi:hypothetical protein
MKTPRALVALLLATSALAGCHTAVRYRLQDRHPRADAGRACVAACNAADGDRYACYATCPGVEVTEGVACTPADRAAGTCTTDEELAVVGTLLVSAGVLLGGMTLVSAAAMEDADFSCGCTIGRELGPQHGAAAPIPGAATGR